MKLVWTPQALQDRIAIWDSIASDNPAAAAKMDQLFSDTAKRLQDYPLSGRAGMIESTRELIPHPSYRLVYQIEDETVWVLTVVHTARQWPAL